MFSSFVSNRSLYRDLLFLTLVALGKNNINISKLELSPETSCPPAGQRFSTHLFYSFAHTHTVKKNLQSITWSNRSAIKQRHIVNLWLFTCRCFWPGVQDGVRSSQPQPGQAHTQLRSPPRSRGHGVQENLWRTQSVNCSSSFVPLALSFRQDPCCCHFPSASQSQDRCTALQHNEKIRL